MALALHRLGGSLQIGRTRNVQYPGSKVPGRKEPGSSVPKVIIIIIIIIIIINLFNQGDPIEYNTGFQWSPAYNEQIIL